MVCVILLDRQIDRQTDRQMTDRQQTDRQTGVGTCRQVDIKQI